MLRAKEHIERFWKSFNIMWNIKALRYEWISLPRIRICLVTVWDWWTICSRRERSVVAVYTRNRAATVVQKLPAALSLRLAWPRWWSTSGGRFLVNGPPCRIQECSREHNPRESYHNRIIIMIVDHDHDYYHCQLYYHQRSLLSCAIIMTNDVKTLWFILPGVHSIKNLHKECFSSFRCSNPDALSEWLRQRWTSFNASGVWFCFQQTILRLTEDIPFFLARIVFGKTPTKDVQL